MKPWLIGTGVVAALAVGGVLFVRQVVAVLDGDPAAARAEAARRHAEFMRQLEQPQPAGQPVEAQVRPLPPVRPVQLPPPAARPAEATTRLPESEVSNYKNEMKALGEKAKIKGEGGQQMRDIGALDRAMELLEEASQMLDISKCLSNQMDRGVPFYQGKATCSAAEGRPR